jgi:hypothetical protein
MGGHELATPAWVPEQHPGRQLEFEPMNAWRHAGPLIAMGVRVTDGSSVGASSSSPNFGATTAAPASGDTNGCGGGTPLVLVSP